MRFLSRNEVERIVEPIERVGREPVVHPGAATLARHQTLPRAGCAGDATTVG